MGGLKAKAPEGGAIELPESATINDALTALEIEPAQIQIAMHNGKPAPDRTRELADGDELTILPPVGGG